MLNIIVNKDIMGIKELSIEKIDKAYNTVLYRVKNGMNITKAIKGCGVSNKTFYNRISVKQLLEINMHKTSHRLW
jgi:hypothetical protein